MPKLSALPFSPRSMQPTDYLVGVRLDEYGNKVDVQYQIAQLPVGLKGDTGATGAQGEQGIQGEQGERGIQGEQGEKGEKGDKGDTGATGVTGLTWEGTWVSGTSYQVNDAVAYGGSSYFCIVATSGVIAPNLDTTNWALLAAQGAKGDKGDIGNTGAQGIQGPQGPQGIQGIAGVGANPSSDVIGVGQTYGSITSATVVTGGTGVAVGAIYEIGFGATGSKAYVRVTAVTLGVATAVEIIYSGYGHISQTNNAFKYSGTGSSSIRLAWVATTGYTSNGYYDYTGFVADQLAEGRYIKQISKDQKTYLLDVDYVQWEGYLQSISGSGLTFIEGQYLILWT